MAPNAMKQRLYPQKDVLADVSSHHAATSSTRSNSGDNDSNSNKLTACFVFPEASGHINASLSLASFLTSQSKNRWDVHYLSAKVMKVCIEDAGATFTDERDVAPGICQSESLDDDNENNNKENDDNRLGYFAAYERFRKQQLPPGSKAWEGRYVIIFRLCVICVCSVSVLPV